MYYLVGNLQVWKEWYISCPFDGAKQQPGGQLADILDAHQVAARLSGGRRHEGAAATGALSAAAAREAASGHSRRVRLGAKQH